MKSRKKMMFWLNLSISHQVWKKIFGKIGQFRAILKNENFRIWASACTRPPVPKPLIQNWVLRESLTDRKELTFNCTRNSRSSKWWKLRMLICRQEYTNCNKKEKRKNKKSRRISKPLRKSTLIWSYRKKVSKLSMIKSNRSWLNKSKKTSYFKISWEHWN